MASLPTAYASQRFGRKSLDFYAAAGDVIGSDPRARADERRLQDLEGARHTVRLMESGFQLDPGERASVLRMQPGPARRSRPVAVVNHSTGTWSRTHPGATGLLARAGVSRAMNWALVIALFAVAGLAAVWPLLRAFLLEIDPSVFAAAPAIDLLALAAGAVPGLADWRISEAVAPLAAALTNTAPGLAPFAAPAAFAASVLTASIVVFALRSWRLVWAPLLVLGIAAGALGFAGASGALAPMLSGLAIAAAVFLVGGAINRVRDAARLERRIAVLADHILRHPPEEMVAGAMETEDTVREDAGETPDTPVREARDDAAPAAAASAAYRGAPEPSPEPSPEPAPADGPDDKAAAQTVSESGSDLVSEPVAESELDRSVGGDPVSDNAGDGDADQADAPHASAEPAADTHAHTAPASDSPEPSQSPDAEGDLDAPTAKGFEQEESERLRTDPRYASRAIVLPPPPPMPAASSEAEGPGETAGEPDASEPSAAPGSQTRTLKPDGPLAANVVPIFAAPVPQREDDEPVD